MVELLYQDLLNVMFTDPQQALQLFKDSKDLFFDPIKGLSFHAEAMYCAIKKADFELLRWLANLPVQSDVSFFKLCGNTPLGVAVEENHQDLIPLLLNTTDQKFALHMAVALNLSKTKAFLLKTCSFSQRFLQFLGV